MSSFFGSGFSVVGNDGSLYNMNSCARNVISRTRLAALIVLIAVVNVVCLNNAAAATFTVNSTGDAADLSLVDGVCNTGATNSQGAAECTLRAAIQQANNLVDSDTINFNIPITEAGYSAAPLSYTIQPAAALPIVAAQLNIDGSSQPDFPGTPIIVVDGGPPVAPSNGIVVGTTATDSTLRSLVVIRFNDNGILLLSDGNLVAGNYVGIAADGLTVAPNNVADLDQQGGIRIESSSNTIGGTSAADRNVISGNLFAGISLFGTSASGNFVYGNYIGVDANGALDRGNSQEGIDIQLGSSNTIGGPGLGQRNILSGNGSDGIEIDGGDFNIVQGNYIGTDVSGNILIPNVRDGVDINEEAGDGSLRSLIGGTDPAEGNLIRGNGIAGVEVRGAPAIDNSIIGNRIYENGLLDIDLNADGLSANDPLDIDTGSNETLNYPEIIAATVNAGTVTVYVSLDVPAGDYRIEFFTNPSGTHSSGNGGGENFIAAQTFTHAGAGSEVFAHTFSGSVGDVVTVTATEVIAGPAFASTSEFSAPFSATLFVPYFARWPLDETAGLTAADIAASNDGTYTNGVLLNQPGACSGTATAVHFDGIDDYIEVPHTPEYLMDEGTVSLWVNIDVAGEQMFFSKDSTNLDTGGHLTLYVNAAGNLEVRLQSTTPLFNFVTGPALATGTWTHMAVTWGPDGLALYANGGAPATNPYMGGLGVTSGGAGNFEPIAFGASTINSGDLVVTPLNNFMAGFLDDVRILNRALTQAEIQVLSTCTPNPSVVKRAYWPDGTPIPSGATIPSGVEFKYMLYINNKDFARNDVSVRDVLNPAFQYLAGTIQVSNSVAECATASCTPAEEQAVFAATDAVAFLSDVVDGDVASYNGASTSVDAGNSNASNQTLNINGDSVWAIMFSAKMP